MTWQAAGVFGGAFGALYRLLPAVQLSAPQSQSLASHCVQERLRLSLGVATLRPEQRLPVFVVHDERSQVST